MPVVGHTPRSQPQKYQAEEEGVLEQPQPIAVTGTTAAASDSANAVSLALATRFINKDLYDMASFVSLIVTATLLEYFTTAVIIVTPYLSQNKI